MVDEIAEDNEIVSQAVSPAAATGPMQPCDTDNDSESEDEGFDDAGYASFDEQEFNHNEALIQKYLKEF